MTRRRVRSSLLATQSSWWNNYWGNSGLIEMNSSDGTAQYMENLRTLYLYFEAATMHAGTYPGSQAGVADLFNFSQDKQDWYPAGYWLWNLRGQLAANISSGNFALNTPIFDMYLNDLPNIESWTSAQMGGKAGACVPETMRFNGNGYYNGGNNTQNASCAQASSPSYNALTITSGAEIALWVWQQYQDTGNVSFLQKYYPILKQTCDVPAGLPERRLGPLPARHGERARDAVGRPRPDHRHRRRARRCSLRR